MVTPFPIRSHKNTTASDPAEALSGREPPFPLPASYGCRVCIGFLGGFCSAAGRRGLDGLEAIGSRREVPNGTLLAKEREAATHYFLLMEGRAQLFATLPDGRRQIMAFLDPGQLIGPGPGRLYPFGVEATGPLSYCCFPTEKLRALAEEHPALQKWMNEAAVREIGRLQERLLLLGRKTAREKLASFLLERAGGMGESRLPPPEVRANRNGVRPRDSQASGPGTEPLVAPLPMTRAAIADYLGLTIETVSRLFTQFKNERLIRLRTTHEAILLQPHLLNEIASGAMMA